MKVILLLVILALVSTKSRLRHALNQKKAHSRGRSRSRQVTWPYLGLLQMKKSNILDDKEMRSGVDDYPWNYRMVNPEEMKQMHEINKADPNSYNMQEDKENKHGCDKKPEYEAKKNKIYENSPDPYYDPTYEARLETYSKDILDVPVVMERDLQTDQQALENQRKQLYNANQNKYYYDPTVLDHMTDLEVKDTPLHRAFEPYRGTIKLKEGQKTQQYDESFQQDFVRDNVMHHWKTPHQQPIPLKNSQSVYQKIRVQQNAVKMEELKHDVLPPLNKNQRKRR